MSGSGELSAGSEAAKGAFVGVARAVGCGIGEAATCAAGIAVAGAVRVPLGRNIKISAPIRASTNNPMNTPGCRAIPFDAGASDAGASDLVLLCELAVCKALVGWL